MRRKGLLLSMLILLLLPLAAEAQCRKRILVFLDVSGSMLKPPADRSSTVSPFQQSLEALQALLQQQGFIEADDTVEIVQFSGAINRKESAKGNVQATALLQNMTPPGKVPLTTDFRIFLSELAKALQESSPYNSQVILLGSDLVHEVRNGMLNQEALRDWDRVLDERKADLEIIQANAEKTTTLLFTPPAPSGRQPVQARVGEDLTRLLPHVTGITPGEANQGGLARRLLLALLRPPGLTVSRDSQDPKKLSFVVANPNCYALKIKELRIQRLRPDGSTGEPFRYSVGADESSLGGTGTPEATRVLTRPLPTGGEWEGVTDLKGEVDTSEGLIGKTQGTAATWLKFKPVKGVLERYLVISPALRLDLQIQGNTVEPRNYPLGVRVVAQAEGAGALAEAKFSAPESADSQRAKTMRIVLPASRELHRQIQAQAPFRVEIDSAQTLEEKGDRVEIVEDPAANRSNLFLLLASGFAIPLTALSFARVRQIAARYPTLQPERSFVWIFVGVAALVPLLINLFHIGLMRLLSTTSVDWLAVGFSVIAVFSSLTYGLMKVGTVRFGRTVLSEDPPLDLIKYKRRSTLGNWLPWAIGLTATLVFLAAWFLVRPPVSANLGRDANPPQLRVVSD